MRCPRNRTTSSISSARALRFELSAQRAIAEDQHAQIGMGGLQVMDRLEQIAVTLARFEPRGHRHGLLVGLEAQLGADRLALGLGHLPASR